MIDSIDEIFLSRYKNQCLLTIELLLFNMQQILEIS